MQTSESFVYSYLSLGTAFPTRYQVHPVQTQIILCSCCSPEDAWIFNYPLYPVKILIKLHGCAG